MRRVGVLTRHICDYDDGRADPTGKATATSPFLFDSERPPTTTSPPQPLRWSPHVERRVEGRAGPSGTTSQPLSSSSSSVKPYPLSSSARPPVLRFSPEVKRALEEQNALNRPHNAIVALESTIVSHGMPYPENYETAKEVEAIVRSCGAVPATICVLNGEIHVGLTDEQLHRIAKNESKSIQKLSRRDLPYAVAHGLDGATTVASTMMIAKMANIRLFVTGGIGGVHRSYGETMDVSADLMELGRTAVGVVCAGVKSILDVPRTLEVLETNGVGVYGYETDEFPCFYYDESGLKVRRVDGSEACARVVDGCVQADGRSGVVIAVGSGGGGVNGGGIMGNAYREETEVIKHAIGRALEEAKAQGVGGSDETPFLLRRVAELTGGASLRRNIALIKRNARVGGEIAKALSGLLS